MDYSSQTNYSEEKPETIYISVHPKRGKGYAILKTVRNDSLIPLFQDILERTVLSGCEVLMTTSYPFNKNDKKIAYKEYKDTAEFYKVIAHFNEKFDFGRFLDGKKQEVPDFEFIVF